MKTYTEEQLKAAMEYACQHQKANSYQMAGEHLIVYPEDLHKGSIAVLDDLADTDDTDAYSIDMADVKEFINERVPKKEMPKWFQYGIMAFLTAGIIFCIVIGCFLADIIIKLHHK